MLLFPLGQHVGVASAQLKQAPLLVRVERAGALGVGVHPDHQPLQSILVQPHTVVGLRSADLRE